LIAKRYFKLDFDNKNPVGHELQAQLSGEATERKSKENQEGIEK